MTNQKNRVKCARRHLDGNQTPKRRKEKEDMIKTITIVLGLAAGIATANTLPPTPEAPVAVELR